MLPILEVSLSPFKLENDFNDIKKVVCRFKVFELEFGSYIIELNVIYF